MWHAFNLKSHMEETFGLSKKAFFIENGCNIVSLYMAPPNRAVALRVDEKLQLQTLARRTQPLLPISPGYPERRAHDYVRNGNTSLFTALGVATGKVIGRGHRQHRHQEFLHFLRVIKANAPEGLDVHLVMENCAMHKMPKIKTWLARSRIGTPISHPQEHLGSTSWNGSSQRLPNGTSGEAPFPAYANSKRLSTIVSRRVTMTKKPSSGLQQPTKSSEKSPHPDKRIFPFTTRGIPPGRQTQARLATQ
jgi:hypothetical protein